MDTLGRAAVVMVAAAWVGWGVLLGLNHIRVRKARGNVQEKSIRDPRSMHGLFIEGAAIFLAFVLRNDDVIDSWRVWGTFLFAPLSIIILVAALRHLDMEWRIKAVVTEDHHLITTGPYSVVRHPIYLALFCLLLATLTCFTHMYAIPWIVLVFLWGTSIRIKAEDGLLERRFGPQFIRWRDRTKALIPLAW